MRDRWTSRTQPWKRLSLLWLWLWLPPTSLAAPPAVVASIQPVHSLVTNVMQGVGEPALLLPGGASPHDHQLKPSAARAIDAAQAVFWIGPELEGFLVKPLANVQSGRVVALIDAPGVKTLPLRGGGVWEAHAHDHDRATGRDPHIWLDPVNAAAMARQIAATLGEIDPGHRGDYERNGTALLERLTQWQDRLDAELAPIKPLPYVVFHDAYQYFEQRFGLNAVGSVVLDPAQRPGAQRLTAIRTRIRDREARCVFSEPQFQPALVATVIAGSDARVGVLDPLGAELPSGPDAYFQLLQGLADALRGCLSRA